MIPLTRLRRSINGVLILAEVAEQRGLPLRHLLAGTGLQKADLDNPARTVAFDEEFRLIRNLLAHCGDPAGLGFEAGSRYQFTSLASIGFAVVSSPTLRRAFEMSVRYGNLAASMVRVVVDTDAPDLHVGFREAELPPDIRRFALERTLAVGLTIYSGLLGRRVVPQSIAFSFPRPADAGIYADFIGVEPAFGATKTVVILKQADVDEPLFQANPLALHMAEDYCGQLLRQVRVAGGLAAEVRERLAAEPARIGDMKALAAALCMSDRTLRRRLQAEGTSYLALCDEIRETLAEQLLTRTRLPIDQVARRLGYAEPASFIHAFKRWKGLTPHVFRSGS